MSRADKIILHCLLLLLVASCTVENPSLKQRGTVHYTEFPNGLQLLLLEDHSLPIVTIQYWFKVGSVYEQHDKRGIAHFLEHMIFKGTEKIPPGTFDHAIESWGGLSNAGTGKDFTYYYVTIPVEKFADGLSLLTEMLRKPRFDQQEIEREREVVIEEGRKEINDIQYDLARSFDALFYDNEYRNSIVGTKETLHNITREDMLTFHQTYYSPNNAYAIIVGNISPASVVNTIAPKIRDWDKQIILQKTFPQNSFASKAQNKTRNMTTALIKIGFSVPSASSPELATGNIISTILGAGKSSRVQQILRNEKSLIISGGVDYNADVYTGLFFAALETKPELAIDALHVMRREFERLKQEPVSQFELQKAKNMLVAGKSYQLESVDEQAISLGSFALVNQIERYNTFLDEINSVTAEDILAFAKKYFNNETTMMLLPEEKS